MTDTKRVYEAQRTLIGPIKDDPQETEKYCKVTFGNDKKISPRMRNYKKTDFAIMILLLITLNSSIKTNNQRHERTIALSILQLAQKKRKCWLPKSALEQGCYLNHTNKEHDDCAHTYLGVQKRAFCVTTSKQSKTWKT